MNRQSIDHPGKRFGLHYFGSQAIIPGAAAAARAVFEACGGAVGWKSWVTADGRTIKTAQEILARFLDDHPDAAGKAAYDHLRSLPGFSSKPTPWDEAPMQVRGAYETFRSVYLLLWIMVRTHDETMAWSLPPRPRPRLVEDAPADSADAAGEGTVR